MPEYLAPGVYVEETSFRAKSIEGVSTSTAAFVGPTRFGPTRGEPEMVGSYAEFERIYAGLDRLDWSGTNYDNYIAHAVRNFFEEGGARLYVSRVFTPKSVSDTGIATGAVKVSSDTKLTIKARYPGAAGNLPVTFRFKLGQNIIGREKVDPSNAASASYNTLRGLQGGEVVYIRLKDLGADPDLPASKPAASSPDVGQLYAVERYFDGSRYTFKLHPWNDTDGTKALTMAALDDDAAVAVDDTAADTFTVQVLTCSVQIGRSGQFGAEQLYENLQIDPAHTGSLTQVFAAEPSSKATALYNPLVMTTALTNGAELAYALLAQATVLTPEGETTPLTILETLNDAKVADSLRGFKLALAGGNDGLRPVASDFEGEDALQSSDGLASGLKAIELIEDVSIVAAPGHSFGYEGAYASDAAAIMRLLISHAERMRYRIAVLDSGENQLISQVRDMRAKVDSTHAALYYPWIKVMDPVTRTEIALPPSGFVTGIYARNDVENGVHKAPANEVVRGALGLTQTISKAQQDVLNPEGINCFRFFEGRGIRLWGARTISSDPEWKYVNLRRYFAYLERSIEKGTQWVVFMNNADGLWDKVKRTINDFLFNEWKNERLLGTKPEESYFVRCDRSTMTQNDLDNGRLICLVGVSPVRPAEFVIFRIGQWTADRKS
ncbi:MAG TPA: phage tail sheath subtilisin-like domain-containing protein [Symbiobacteriaceae bacterium]|nr:phage tail sheath subtilisin-like domain-containing protein [Symbiobacteriaceae bacterium]